MTSARDRTWLALSLSIVTALWSGLELLHPRPFATGGDTTYYYLPYIYSTHDAILRFGRPHVEWALGQGWSPLESGQLGIGYPPYLVATVLARSFHRPDVTLELSALFTLLLVVCVVFLFGTSLPARVRAAMSLAVCTGPAALLYGVASHDFLTTLPWVTGLGLVVVEGLRDGSGFRPARHLFTLGLLEALFFWVCHPHMFVIVNALLAILTYGIAKSWEDVLRGSLALVGASLVVCVPLAYFAWLSTIVKVTTADAHDAFAYFRTSPPFLSMLEWTLAGGLFQGAIWHRGWLFFSPALVVAVAAGLRTRRARPVQATLATLVLLAPRVLPESLWFDPVVLRMRWPEKVTTLTSALAIVLVACVVGRSHPRRIALGLSLAAVLGAAAFLFGLDTEPIPNARQVGVGAVREDTQRCLDTLGVPVGARLAWVGGFSTFPMTERYPLPLLGLTGGGPLLVGRASAHVYEPLEPDVIHRAHARLDAPWRTTVSAARLAANDPGTLATLRDLGVSWLVALDAASLSPLGTPRSCVDRQGQRAYAVALPAPRVVSFPWAVVDGVREALVVRPDGALETQRPSVVPPMTNLARKTNWQKMPDGRWHGETPLISWGWVIGTIGTMTAWFVVAAVLRRKELERVVRVRA